MSEFHFPVPGSVDEGKIVLFVRRHWASFLGQFFLSFFMLVLPIIIIVIIYFSDAKVYEGIARNFIVIGLSTYYLISVTVAFIAWISFYYDLYIVTTDSIVDVVQQGFFGRKISQLSLLRVQDVTSNISGFIPTFFAFGDVLVETAGEQSQNFLLKAVPNPQEMAAKIMELHNNIIETEGRHHQILEAEGSLAPGTIKSGIGHVAGEHPSPPPAPTSVPPTTSTQTPMPNKENQPEMSYQELLRQEQNEEKPIQPQTPVVENSQSKEEGQISHDDLDKGGEIDLK